MAAAVPLEARSRDELARLGLEYMLMTYFTSRAIMPALFQRFGPALATAIVIDEWRAASPVYTRRLRSVMGIAGDDVAAILKALQLDVGFVHQFMDVGYEVSDARHATFWLARCGALLDTESRGADAVLRMCHHIEDPTFPATACATNPRARVLPIHRPPRVPADRLPHCHWAVTIDPDAPPLVDEPIAHEVAALPLAGLPNPVPPDRESGGWRDYGGPFDPGFRLACLSQGALVAALREFQMQGHLLVAALDLLITRHADRATARAALAQQWAGVSWIVSERLRATLGGGDGPGAVAAVLPLHPAFPPGTRVEAATVGAGDAEVVLEAPTGWLDADAAGWLGLLAAGEPAGIAGMVQGCDARARVVEAAPTATGQRWRVRCDPATPPAEPPAALQAIRASGAATFRFR